MITIAEILMLSACGCGLYALIARPDLRSIRWNLQAAVLLLFAMCALAGCSAAHAGVFDDVVVVWPDAHKAPDGHTIITRDYRFDRTVIYQSDCDQIRADQRELAHCVPSSAEQVAQYEADKAAWFEKHTVTIPVGKCIIGDGATTALGYAVGFHEGGLPIILKLGVTWWQVQMAKAYAAQGDPSFAMATCATHAAGAGINLLKMAAH